MNRSDEVVAKPNRSVDKLGEKLRASFEDLQRTSDQRNPAKDLHDDVLSEISHRLDHGTSERKAIYYGLLAIEDEIKKKRGSRGGLTRYLVAICIGVATTLAWQSYSEATKRIIATKAPELGWSPETKHMIAGWVQKLGWKKLPAGPENTAVQASVLETQVATAAQTVPTAVVPKVAIPSIDPAQVRQIALDLAALRETVEHLAAGQEQITRVTDRLEGAVAEILTKIPAPPPPTVAPTRKPTTSVPPSLRAPPPSPRPFP
jgi:hypothetical protein